MRTRWLVLVLGLGFLPAAAAAESASPLDRDEPTRLQTEMKHRRFVVLPRPDPQAAARGIEQATAEVESRPRPEHRLREAIEPPSRRPDLDPAVTRGIQGRNLQRALGR
jgi:hypothetical protein